MSTEQALVLRDVEGTYYVILPAVLEASRVPAEQQQALQAAIGDEVSGYIAASGPANLVPMINYGPAVYPFPLPYLQQPVQPLPWLFQPDPRNC